MDMKDTHWNRRLRLGFHYKKLGDLFFVHQGKRLGRELVGGHDLRRPRHHLAGFGVVQILIEAAYASIRGETKIAVQNGSKW